MIFQRAMCCQLTNRGINRGAIFQDDADRRYLTDLVKDYRDARGAAMAGCTLWISQMVLKLHHSRGTQE